jgi:hypothetical protein
MNPLAAEFSDHPPDQAGGADKENARSHGLGSARLTPDVRLKD